MANPSLTFHNPMIWSFSVNKPQAPARIQYYLIHGIDATRKPFMLTQFQTFGIDNQAVKWLLEPNVGHDLPEGICINPSLTKGQVCCTYKHYLALRDIVQNGHEYGVIMEDNICFLDHVPDKLNRYLRDLPAGWDCLFDGDFLNLHYLEQPVRREVSVYKKSNEPTAQCHGSSRGANFILIHLRAATRLYDSFLPFDAVSDHYYNHLFRKLNMNVYWAEPPNVHKVKRTSTWR